MTWIAPILSILNSRKLIKMAKKLPLNIGVRNLSKPTSQAKNIKTIQIG